MLLAHKVSKVGHPVPFLASIADATGPLRTLGSSRCPRLVELLFPQSHLSNPSSIIRGKHDCRQMF
jgi:hypothetical protein